MGHHRHHPQETHTCSASDPIREPPSKSWSGGNAIAWAKNSSATDELQVCCGSTTKVTSYYDDCYQFCNLGSNVTEVKDCFNQTGVSFAEYEKTKKSDAKRLSTPAFGVVLMVVMSLFLELI